MTDNIPHPIYIRHPKCWESETRTLVYAVENTIYHFSLSVLKMMSPPLTAIFDIPVSVPVVGPDGKVVPAEGTETNPIVLPGISVKQFDDFLAFFFKSDLIQVEDISDGRKEELCMNLLTVGSLWDIDEAKAYTKSNLIQMGLPAPRRLHIARQFAIHEWVDTAVRELIPQSGNLDTDAALVLGPTTLCILYQAKTALEKERLLVAHVAPKLTAIEDLNYGDCVAHRNCERAIREGWWTLVGKEMLHPTHPMALDAIGTHLDKIVFPGMSRKCHEDMVAKWTSNTFEHEGIIEAAVAGVAAFHRYCRIS
ncbi:hypothetical protein FB451DRAFT_1408409 [Mycena latifolia]|nr:hypothetical protein FB451DRAFT_1408409 [Mycena latifolia]